MNAITHQDLDQGVCQHSMADSLESYILFSVTPKTRAVFLHWAMSERVGYKAIRGKYQGKIEPGYIVNAKHFDALWLGGSLARQRCILLLGPLAGETRASQARPATLVQLQGGLPAALGYMVAIDKREALEAGEWTYDISADCYYVCQHATSLTEEA